MKHSPSLKFSSMCLAVLYGISQDANGQNAIGQAMSLATPTHTAREAGETVEPVAVVNAESDYSAAIEQLSVAIRHEVESKQLPAFSIALIDDDKTVWSAGFGHQDAEKKIPATADTVYRVGSVSKLFTDIAIMQLVESGQIDLDAPVQTYLPSFAPKNPFEVAITLRQLMSHRSGLVRESPVGHYFDPDGPNGSRHNRGCAVDITLYELASGEPIQMVAGYDEFSARSFPMYPGGTSRQRWYRELLRHVMEAEGFTVYEFEWWHFDFKDWKRYRIGNRTFEEIAH